MKLEDKFIEELKKVDIPVQLKIACVDVVSFSESEELAAEFMETFIAFCEESNANEDEFISKIEDLYKRMADDRNNSVKANKMIFDDMKSFVEDKVKIAKLKSEI